MSSVAKGTRSRASIKEKDLPAWTFAQSQPATYPRQFLDVARVRGVDRDAVLAHAGVEPARIDDPAGRLSLIEMWRLHEAVAARLDDPAFGFEVGLRLPLTAHGNLGYALMCAATPREAIALLERYWHLRGRSMVMHTRAREGELFLEVAPELPMPTWLRDHVLSSVLSSMWRGMTFLMPTTAPTIEMWLAFAEPPGLAPLRARLPRLRFDMPVAGLLAVGDLALLDEVQPTANPEALAHALASCERESALMGHGADPLVARAAAALHLHGLRARGYPSPAAVAKALHVTPRTFRRRLQEQGTSYSVLLEAARRRDACRMLAGRELPIKEIGAVLGYDDPANFTRAFRAWTGMSPRAWREQHAAEAAASAGRAGRS